MLWNECYIIDAFWVIVCTQFHSFFVYWQPHQHHRIVILIEPRRMAHRTTGQAISLATDGSTIVLWTPENTARWIERQKKKIENRAERPSSMSPNRNKIQFSHLHNKRIIRYPIQFGQAHVSHQIVLLWHIPKQPALYVNLMNVTNCCSYCVITDRQLCTDNRISSLRHIAVWVFLCHR